MHLYTLTVCLFWPCFLAFKNFTYMLKVLQGEETRNASGSTWTLANKPTERRNNTILSNRKNCFSHQRFGVTTFLRRQHKTPKIIILFSDNLMAIIKVLWQHTGLQSPLGGATLHHISVALNKVNWAISVNKDNNSSLWACRGLRHS